MSSAAYIFFIFNDPKLTKIYSYIILYIYNFPFHI